MEALRYETFIRNAFSYALNKSIDRSGDPAGLAEADIYNDRNLNKVKVGACYAIEIFTDSIMNKVEIDENEDKRISAYFDKVMKCKNVLEIGKLIEDFRKTVVDKYYNINDGRFSLKS